MPQVSGNNPNPTKAGVSQERQPLEAKGSVGLSYLTGMLDFPNIHIGWLWPSVETHRPIHMASLCMTSTDATLLLSASKGLSNLIYNYRNFFFLMRMANLHICFKNYSLKRKQKQVKGKKRLKMNNYFIILFL